MRSASAQQISTVAFGEDVGRPPLFARAELEEAGGLALDHGHRPQRRRRDAPVPLLLGDGVRQHGHAHLGDEVRRLARHFRDADRRRHHHDAAAPALAHVRDHRARAEERAAHVDLHHQVELAGRPLGQRREVDGAGVVDEDVDAAEFLERGIPHPLHVVEFAHVAAHRQRAAAELAHFLRRVVDGAGEARVRLVGLGGDHDVAALAGKRQRDGAADAAR